MNILKILALAIILIVAAIIGSRITTSYGREIVKCEEFCRVDRSKSFFGVDVSNGTCRCLEVNE